MPCKRGRKHTPITSERQRRFFGAEYGRLKRGEARKTDISREDLRSHLKEVKGKKLPEVRGIGASGPTSKSSSKRSRSFSKSLASKGKRRK